MHIVILGAGQVGTFIASNLSREHDIVIIEKDADTSEKIRETHDVLIIQGDGDNPKVLRQAQIEKAQVMLAVSGNDKVNIMAATWAASVGVPKIIVRIRDTDYLEYPDLIQNSETLIVHPGRIISDKIISLIGSPFAWKTEKLAMGKIKMLKLKVEENTPVEGKKLMELGPAKAWIFAAVSRDGIISIPTGETKLKTGDYVYAIGVPSVLGKLKEMFGVKEEHVRSTVIVGGGRLGRGVAKTLSERGIDVKLVENNPDRAALAASELNKVLVFRGDATDSDTLMEVGVESADYFIALTGDDENNVLSALLAKNLGARRTTVLYTKPDYIDVIEAIGVDRAISVRLSVANEILSMLHLGGIAQVALIDEGKAEVLEFDVTDKSDICGKALRDVHFPADCLVGIALRGEDVIIPRGDYVAEAGDRIIIFTLPEAEKKVEKILSR